jgi:hypothetical protein
MHFRALKKTAQDVYISDPVETDKDVNTLTLIDIITDNSDVVEDLDLKVKLQKLLAGIQNLEKEKAMLAKAQAAYLAAAEKAAALQQTYLQKNQARCPAQRSTEAFP